ncbi:hypothetical protein DL240_07820 [Lujinxingia litoralis]|uniref:Uncharacterized protein n=1 Tax=Lujinxingia litoralis TaxID=2211119 RepID=A0A328C5E3_9DELT|nr:hypothetical protein [Lujinxingia litoralis]RAL22791.1 hypothetical protein DL240_07820 [Lujinxingia litoralis]
MIRRELQALSSPNFQQLAVHCGLDISELDLSQLSRRRLVAPLEVSGEVEGGYTRLHLFVLARYLEAVRPVRHPWGSRAAGHTLDEVAELGRELEAIFEGLGQGRVGEDLLSRADRVLRELERFLAGCDPFGPLGEVIDLLNPEFVARLRNQGRLYAELRGASRALADALQVGESRPAREPMTRPMFQFDVEAAARQTPTDELRSTQVIDEPMETSARAREAIDEVFSAASEVSESAEEERVLPRQARQTPASMTRDELRSTAVIEVSLEDIDVLDEDSFSEPAPAEASAPEELHEQVTQGDEACEKGQLAEESSDPILLTEEKPEVEASRTFRRASQPTERTLELNERLARLRADDGERNPPTAIQADATDEPTAPTQDLSARIEELNRRRETYLKEQAWEPLAELYESGIELFADAGERQQVFLVLAMLYEVKLRQKEKAFDAFARAFGERQALAGRGKALEGLQRLGRAASLHQGYVEWLQMQLSTPLDEQEREGMQKELALALFSDRQYQKAFLCYASFLADAPERNVTAESLAQLARLGEYIEAEEVQSFYDDLLEQELSPSIAGLIREQIVQGEQAP